MELNPKQSRFAEWKTKAQSFLKALQIYFQVTIWLPRSERPLGLAGQFLNYTCRVLYTIVISFSGKQRFLQASALTFMTSLSLVPLLALAFSVSKGLGLQNTIREAVLERMAAGQQEIVSRLIDYVDQTDVKALGTIGVLLFLYIAISVMGSVERSFNDIWEIRKERTFHRKFSDYLSVILVSPLLLAVATGFNASLSSNTVINYLLHVRFVSDAVQTLLHLTPLFVIWVAFTFLYVFLPNTRVRFLAALGAGLVAGAAWHLAQWGYIHFQVGVSRYNTIYGTFASLPIFLVWLKIHWIIVLGGCELAFALQHAKYHQLLELDTLSIATRERLCLQAVLLAAQRFAQKDHPMSLNELASIMNVPPRVIGGIRDLLVDAGILMEAGVDRDRLLFARDPHGLNIHELLLIIRHQGKKQCLKHPEAGHVTAENVLRDFEDAFREQGFAHLSLHELAISTAAEIAINRREV